MTPEDELAMIIAWQAEYEQRQRATAQRLAELATRRAELEALLKQPDDVMAHALRDPGYQQFLLRKQLERKHATERLSTSSSTHPDRSTRR